MESEREARWWQGAFLVKIVLHPNQFGIMGGNTRHLFHRPNGFSHSCLLPVLRSGNSFGLIREWPSLGASLGVGC